MKSASTVKGGNELDRLCASVRAFVIDGAYENCIEAICEAMERYPHAPQPHNLLGIIQQQAFIDEMTSIIPVGKGRVQIMEINIPGESPAAGRKLWEISLPKEAIVGCILRGDSTLIPRGDTRILGGDTLVLITGNGQEMNAVRALTGR